MKEAAAPRLLFVFVASLLLFHRMAANSLALAMIDVSDNVSALFEDDSERKRKLEIEGTPDREGRKRGEKTTRVLNCP